MSCASLKCFSGFLEVFLGRLEMSIFVLAACVVLLLGALCVVVVAVLLGLGGFASGSVWLGLGCFALEGF